MRIIIYYFLFIVQIVFAFEQMHKITGLNTTKTGIKNSNDKAIDSSLKLKFFLIHISTLILIIIFFFVIIKFSVQCFKKLNSYKILKNNYVKKKLMDEEVIAKVKYIYGFKYVISFLLEKLFVSCKYKEKMEEIKECGNCSICLNGFELKDKIFITLCRHVYHEKCMLDYLKIITKELEPNDIEITDFHRYFMCPNCKEYLYINKDFLPYKNIHNNNDNNDNIPEIQENKKDSNIENVRIIGHKSRQVNKANLLTNSESSTNRNFSKLPINRNQIEIGNDDVSKVTKASEFEGEIQSNMKLKENLAKNNGPN
jgi:hypothetical protein